jgi:hypothetical protein
MWEILFDLLKAGLQWGLGLFLRRVETDQQQENRPLTDEEEYSDLDNLPRK